MNWNSNIWLLNILWKSPGIFLAQILEHSTRIVSVEHKECNQACFSIAKWQKLVLSGTIAETILNRQCPLVAISYIFHSRLGADRLWQNQTFYIMFWWVNMLHTKHNSRILIGVLVYFLLYFYFFYSFF